MELLRNPIVKNILVWLDILLLVALVSTPVILAGMLIFDGSRSYFHAYFTHDLPIEFFPG